MVWNYALDLGADEIRMVMRGADGMYTEAARAVYRRGEAEPFARGEQALEYEGREAGNISVRRVTNAGMPLGYSAAAAWVRRLVALHEKKIPGRKTVLVNVSPFLGETERAMFLRALMNEELDAAGTVETDMACAIGSGADFNKYTTYTVLDMGASQITCSCISGGTRVKIMSLSYGMDRLDDLLRDSITAEMSVLTGREAVKQLKHNVFETAETSIRVPVLSIQSGLPVYAQIPRTIPEGVLDGLMGDLVWLCGETVSNLPAGCAADVLKNGIILAGGGANAYGLDKKLGKRLNLPVKTAENPGKATINGLKRILEEQDRYTLLVNDWRDSGMKA